MGLTSVAWDPSARRRQVPWSRMLIGMQWSIVENSLKEECLMSANGTRVPSQHPEPGGRPKSPRMGRCQRREGQPSLPCSAISQPRWRSWSVWPAGCLPKRYLWTWPLSPMGHAATAALRFVHKYSPASMQLAPLCQILQPGKQKHDW